MALAGGLTLHFWEFSYPQEMSPLGPIRYRVLMTWLLLQGKGIEVGLCHSKGFWDSVPHFGVNYPYSIVISVRDPLVFCR